jgi:hypothetical protein
MLGLQDFCKAIILYSAFSFTFTWKGILKVIEESGQERIMLTVCVVASLNR